MNYDLSLLKQIIISAAREELLPRFAHVQRSIKADGSFVTEADLTTLARILRELQQQYPELGKYSLKAGFGYHRKVFEA